jgi:hypothetical protein
MLMYTVVLQGAVCSVGIQYMNLQIKDMINYLSHAVTQLLPEYGGTPGIAGEIKLIVHIKWPVWKTSDSGVFLLDKNATYDMLSLYTPPEFLNSRMARTLTNDEMRMLITYGKEQAYNTMYVMSFPRGHWWMSTEWKVCVGKCQ